MCGYKVDKKRIMSKINHYTSYTDIHIFNNIKKLLSTFRNLLLIILSVKHQFSDGSRGISKYIVYSFTFSK